MLRIKTTWFKKEGEQRDPAEVATVLASTIWRLSDRCIDNLSHADYDIITPQRGFRIIAELACFLVHYVDRLAFNRMQERIRRFVGQRTDHQAGFIELINRRMVDYSEFVFPEEKASFPALRFLSLQIREVMERSDQTWIQDQVMDIEMPEMMGTVKKSVDGFYPGETAK